ncbi:hypothetical protein [Terrabacter sp. NPDC080008]|uniref:hypothetical protein n=1 Tax=Terrabacter sp. NPDC080008 TaxID=3155176 RepID=UPI00344D9820
MPENPDAQPRTEPATQAASSVRREPFAGTAEEREPERDAIPDGPHAPGDPGDDELEAQAADDFFHDRPAATSARVFDPGSDAAS